MSSRVIDVHQTENGLCVHPNGRNKEGGRWMQVDPDTGEIVAGSRWATAYQLRLALGNPAHDGTERCRGRR